MDSLRRITANEMVHRFNMLDLGSSTGTASHFCPNNKRRQGPIVLAAAEGGERVQREFTQPYKYIAEVAYDGTDYSGFQLQSLPSSDNAVGGTKRRKKSPTIQGQIEKSLEKFIGLPREELGVQGSGRTDAGVHARGQMVHFFSSRELTDVDRATMAINSNLPQDIRVLRRVLRVPLDYNVRFTRGKIYTYDLHLDQILDPFFCRFRYHPRWPHKLNLEALASAAAAFVGSHDFTVFSNKSRDGGRKSPVRTVRRCEISTQVVLPSNGLRIEVEGNGFLYKQVRHMVGAMLAAATGRITPEDISAALEDPIGRGGGRLARPGAYVVAEPQGLCLDTVFLPEVPDPSVLMYDEIGLDLASESGEDEELE